MLEFSIITIGSFVTMLDSITKYIGKFCFKKDISRAIPIFSIIYGVALGICGFYTPNVEMGKNLVEAVFIGISAGAAATGINQVGKQLNKKDDSDEAKPLDEWTEEDWAKAREIILGLTGSNEESDNSNPYGGDIMLMGHSIKDVANELEIKTEEEKIDEDESVEEEKETVDEECEDAPPNEDYNEDE